MERWGRVLFVALVLVLSLVLLREEVQFFFQKDPKLALELIENFNEGVLQRPDLLASQGFVFSRRGWGLLPHTRGRLIYRFPQAVPPGGAVLAYLFFYRPSPQVHNALKLYQPGSQVLTTIGEDVTLRGNRIDLAPYLPSGGVFELVFDATNDAASAFVLLDHMELRMFAGRPPEPPSPPRMFLGLLLCGLAIALLTPGWKRTLPFVLILSVGFYIRYSNFDWVIYTPLDPDAVGYRTYADRMNLLSENGFYSGNFGEREPFFLLVTKIFFQIFGSSDTHLRLLSLLLSLGVIYLVYKQAVDLFGLGWGLVACSAIALNLPLARESGRGLRLELEMVLLLLFCQVAFVRKEQAPFRRFFLMGLLGGFIVLTRASHLPGLVLLMLYSAWRHRRQVHRVALMGSLAILLMVLLFTPHKYGIYKRHGDPFWDTHMYARWYANWEFVGRPGFPSVAELMQDGYVGPKLTYAQYLFQLHTPVEVIIGTLRGFVKIAARMDVVGFTTLVPALGSFRSLRSIDHFVTALGVLGLFVALCSAEFRWLPVGFVSLTFPASFLFDRGLFEAYRLTMHAFPFFLLCGLLAVRQASTWARPRVLHPKSVTRFVSAWRSRR